MATFKALILPHHKKQDGTYNIKIRVNHRQQSVYLSTEYFVSDKQLRGAEIKDRFLIKRLADLVDDCYNQVVALDDKIHTFSAKDLSTYIERKIFKKVTNELDFVAFSRTYIEQLKADGRGSYAAKLFSALNNLIDFFGDEVVPIKDINSKLLFSFEQYLVKDREITRYNQFGNPFTTIKKGMINSGRDVLTNLRTLFNAAKAEYNDEENNDIVITHSPFSKYKIKKAPAETSKRNLKPDLIKKIRDFEPGRNLQRNYDIERDLDRLGQDVFMLSFYLVGMNTADLYNAVKIENGRVIYNRTKTKRRRADDALISIKIEPEVLPLIEKYRDPEKKQVFNFHKRFANSKQFNHAVNTGLKRIGLELSFGDESLTTYYARHSWATIARNICRISKDDIAFALNHVDPDHQVTDIYMEKDWILIDEANRKVLDVIST